MDLGPGPLRRAGGQRRQGPLDPKIAALPGVEFRQESAFGLNPRHAGSFDWLCCDVACYPGRLLSMVERWLEAGTVARFVCTLKFQGDTDHDVARAFARLGGQVIHLTHNKHELTWMKGV